MYVAVGHSEWVAALTKVLSELVVLLLCSSVMEPVQRSASAGSCGQHRNSTTSTRAPALTSLATQTQRSTR
jgi:hypothetical protein